MEVTRNQGIRLNAASLDRQLALRGINARQLAQISGVSETAISQARNGRRRINEHTLRKLSAALVACPLVFGAEMIIGPDDAA